MTSKRPVPTTILVCLVLASSVFGTEPEKHADHPIYQESLEVLTERAVNELNGAAEGIKAWVKEVRPADGSRGRFRWAVEANHAANYVSTSYILEGLDYVGIYDEVITAEDREAGIEWILSTRRPDGSYHDAAMPEGSRKAVWTLARYRDELATGPDPYTSLGKPYPQPHEIEEKAAAWLKTQWDELNPWAAGSRTSRPLLNMLHLYKKGEISIDPLVESLRYLYSIQDPKTGMFGSKKWSMETRINGNMKVFGATQGVLDLPLPYAQRNIDSVLSEMLKPGYDGVGCSELDKWMVLSEAMRKANGYRKEEVQKLAAHSMIRILRDHRAPDGGLSAGTKSCQTGWGGVSMAPAEFQGDALGLALLSRAVSVCVYILNDQEAGSIGNWEGNRGWDPSFRPISKELRDELVLRVFPSDAGSAPVEK